MKKEMTILKEDFCNEEVQKIQIVPYHDSCMKIQKGKRFYILDPHRYDNNSLMMKLDIPKLNKLDEKFSEYKQGLDLKEFIKTMIDQVFTINDDPADEINLVYGLYKLFQEIDYNGDKQMQWQEFTQFIIDSVMGEDKGKKNDDEEDILNNKSDKDEKNFIKFRRYNVSDTVEDKSLHDTEIIDAVFLPKIEKLFICEYKNKKIKIYNPRKGKVENIFDFEKYEKKKSIKKCEDVKEDKTNMHKEKNHSYTYSVLSMTTHHLNIISFCLSDKRIIFVEFGLDGRDEYKFEINTPTLQKRVWFLPDHNVWFSAGKKADNEKYFTLNELDIEFEYVKRQKLEFFTNIGTKLDEKTVYHNPYRYCYGDHGGEILDVIEIKKPMLVLTGCMDKIIRLINLNEKEVVSKWDNLEYHKSAVRCLDYNPNIGVGLILSVGFEYYINVWSPEIALKVSHKGKLEGHYSPVVMCKFICESPMCVSSDEEGNVRIWDTRTFNCLQLIPQEKKNFKMNKLLCIPKYNKFIIYGNKIIFFDPNYRDLEIKPKNTKVEDNYPISVEFNEYYMNFYVCTMKDVRIYSALDGHLIKVFKNICLRAGENSKIKYFTFDDRHRKFYLGFSNGAVHQFNAGNGSLIKPIGEFEYETDGIPEIKNNHTSDISSIFYEPIYKLLISTSHDSSINIYNEKNPEESELLRNIKNGHKIAGVPNQIFSFDFSKNLNLFATGSTNGLITIWEYELSKIDDVCYVDNKNKDEVIDVFSLKFLDPYPILAATYSDGSVYFWGIRPNLKYRAECFIRCRNYNVSATGKIDTSAVICSMYINQEMEEIPKKLLWKKEFTENISNNLINNQIGLLDHVESKLKQSEGLVRFKSSQGIELKNKLSGISKIFKQEANVVNINESDYDYNLNNDEDQEDTELDPLRYEDSSTKSYFIFGDNKGFIRILNMKGIIKKFDFEKATSVEIKSSYNISKKDNINVEMQISHYLQKDRPLLGKYVNIYHHVIVREFQAHDLAITNMTKIKEPFSFITCSKDKKFKIWNFQCELLGEINTQPTLYELTQANQILTDWKFKIDWEKLKEDEIDHLIKIYEELGGEPQKFDDEAQQGKKQFYKKSSDNKLKVIDKKGVNKKEPGINLRRFKALEIQKKENNEDSNEETERFDDHNTLEIKKRIDSQVDPHFYEVGLQEMSKNLLNAACKMDSTRTNFEKEKRFNLNKENLKISKSKNGEHGFKKNLTLKVPKNSSLKKQIDQNNLRESLYSEKFFKKRPHQKDHSKDRKYILPLINAHTNKNENIKFKKGETERLLSYEYYNKCYKSCCEIKEAKDVSLTSLRRNYDLMWNYVRNYSPNMRKKNNFE